MFLFKKTGYSLECHKLSRIFNGLDKTKTTEFHQDLIADLESYDHNKEFLFTCLNDYECRIASSHDFNQILLNNDPETIPLTDLELKEGPLRLKKLIETGKLGALFKKHNIFFLFDEIEFEETYKGFLSNIRLLIFSFLIRSIF
ncbi:hypothetical protein LDVICp049 [lymphocystis disease virus-China]|uniref:Uncharacterized protein n=2 Tax=Lymphocystis disease virus 2 TaxID=159183 RepID=A0A6F8X2I4_9VIRU|nr:hypothetical protein LDVICp049 [lymphocystis disease virus-China]AAU10895.1 hypothetical protein [lymphocystis disease virus-China]BCB67439.1 hypothetical protein [Lymphocystis disease virus 2]